jgi:hypothetical protein
VADEEPSVARTVVVPTLSARTSTAVADVAERPPTVASVIDQFTETPGIVAPVASCTFAVNRAVLVRAAVPVDGTITMPAADTVTGVVTVCVPLAAVSLVVMVDWPTPTPRTSPVASTVAMLVALETYVTVPPDVFDAVSCAVRPAVIAMLGGVTESGPVTQTLAVPDRTPLVAVTVV